MTETAIVRSIENNVIKLGCGHNEGCSSCSSSFCSADTHLFEAANPKGLDLERGDVVEIYLPPGKTVAAGFLVLIVPLLLFAATYLITGRVMNEPGEGIQALFGILGLSVGFLLSFTYSKRRKAANMPVIVSIKGKGFIPVGNAELQH